MLCFNCNAALGHVNDSVERLNMLIAYLNKSSPIKALDDLEKAKHFIELLIELETNKDNSDAPAVESGEWIDWDGNIRPIDPLQIVEVQRKDGTYKMDMAGYFNWTQLGKPSDIIAYRIIKD